MGLGGTLVLQAKFLATNYIFIELMHKLKVFFASRYKFLGHIMFLGFTKVHNYYSFWFQPLIASLEKGCVDVKRCFLSVLDKAFFLVLEIIRIPSRHPEAKPIGDIKTG